MTFTIAFGWWILPLTITIGSFVLATLCSRSISRVDFYGIVALVYNTLAIIVSLIAWLIWALCN